MDTSCVAGAPESVYCTAVYGVIPSMSIVKVAIPLPMIFWGGFSPESKPMLHVRNSNDITNCNAFESTCVRALSACVQLCDEAYTGYK